MAPPRPTSFDYPAQIIENCHFISDPDAVIAIVTSKEAGLHKAHVLKTESGQRQCLFSSDPSNTILMAFEDLHEKSQEAVHNHQSEHGWDFVSQRVIDEGDDEDEAEDEDEVKSIMSESSISAGTAYSDHGSAWQSSSEDDVITGRKSSPRHSLSKRKKDTSPRRKSSKSRFYHGRSTTPSPVRLPAVNGAAPPNPAVRIYPRIPPPAPGYGSHEALYPPSHIGPPQPQISAVPRTANQVSPVPQPRPIPSNPGTISSTSLPGSVAPPPPARPTPYIPISSNRIPPPPPPIGRLSPAAPVPPPPPPPGRPSSLNGYHTATQDVFLTIHWINHSTVRTLETVRPSLSHINETALGYVRARSFVFEKVTAAESSPNRLWSPALRATVVKIWYGGDSVDVRNYRGADDLSKLLQAIVRNTHQPGASDVLMFEVEVDWTRP